MNLNELIEKLKEFQEQGFGWFPVELFWGSTDLYGNAIGEILAVDKMIIIESI